ncbi:MAG: hypothetical protein PHR16_06215 [Methylovulum sp.]|nr:hypothetical protein [Methylovulum sp.]
MIDYFRLKKDTTVKPFAVYLNQAVCLTVTGVGKNAMAAGIAYTQALFAPVEPVVLLNIGIAGHKDQALGGLFLINKMTDADSKKNYYPPLVFGLPCATASVRTASKPQLDYEQPGLYDMEASAFYETAARFSTGELIHCLKVVSDNKDAPVEAINPKQVSALIATHLPIIAGLIGQAKDLATQITWPAPPIFEQLLQQHRFTTSERLQLKELLCRKTVLANGAALELAHIHANSGKEVLKKLAQQLGETDFYL